LGGIKIHGIMTTKGLAGPYADEMVLCPAYSPIRNFPNSNRIVADMAAVRTLFSRVSLLADMENAEE
jgi:hypothetical protein